MEIKIPKEVRQHKETIFFGLSVRQFVCAVLAVAVPIAASLPDAVPEYPLDGDGLLHTAGNFERFPFALVGGGQGFNHSLVPVCGHQLLRGVP